MKTDCQVETISLSIELGLDMYKYSLDLCTQLKLDQETWQKNVEKLDNFAPETSFEEFWN